MNCKQCNKLIDLPARYLRGRKFCSRECSELWQRVNLTINHNRVGTKLCGRCKQTKTLDMFGSKSHGKRIQSYCKSCLYLFQMRRWNKQKVKAIKHLGGRCIKCGSVEHPVNFDFHHRDPSQKDVDWPKLRIRSWSKIMIELDKCDLLCCRCHRLIHYDPRMWEFDN